MSSKGLIFGFTSQGEPYCVDFSRSGPSRSALVVGTSGSGKSVAIRALVHRGIEKGYKFVILETKHSDNGDFLPWYPKIDPYISESSDADTIAELLHSDRNDLSILLDVCKEGDTWEQIYQKLVVESENKKRHPLERKDAKMVAHYLENLLKEMKNMKFRPHLYDIPAVSVMDLRNISDDMKQLVASSIATWLLNYAYDTVFVVDEYHQQGRNRKLESYAAEGRSRGDFLIASDQNITKIHSDLRQNFQIWIAGRQNDKVKADRVVDQSQFANIKRKDVFALKSGFFIVNDYNQSTTDKVFAWGDWYSKEEAVEVATGKKPVDELPEEAGPPVQFEIPNTDDFERQEEDWTDVMEKIVEVKEMLR